MTPTRSEVVSRIRKLFFVTDKIYARSYIKPDGTFGYAPACACSPTCYKGTGCPLWAPEKLSDEVLYRHMTQGTLKPYPSVLGSYSTSQSQTANWVLWDIDNHKEESEKLAKRTVRRIHETLDLVSISCYLEDSGRGFHIWVFCPHIPAETAYRFGKTILEMSDPLIPVEVFPKQEKIKDFGNLVKIPFGLHWSGKRCWFVDPQSLEMIPNQWDALMNFETADVLQLQRVIGSHQQQETPKKETSSMFICNNVTQEEREGILPGPPCVSNMWRARLRDGDGRNQVLFQLAVDLQRGGFLEIDQAREILTLWNEKQIDPLDEREFEQALEHAFNGSRYSYGGSNFITSQYCEPDRCPVCCHREEQQLKSIIYGSGPRFERMR